MTKFLHLQAGLFAYYGPVQDNDWHRHNAIQLIWPSTVCNIETDNATAQDSEVDCAALLASDMKHKLSMEQGWILLIEPQSALGEALHSVNTEAGLHLLTGISLFANVNDDITLDALFPLWQQLGLENYLLEQSPNMDGRILALQQKLDTCLVGSCIKPESWKAASVAQDLAISESRFLHLFKAEMKIAWRPYLLWRRLLCAVNALKHGYSATDAAHIAGFSDSAHLSRTFRKNFGLSIRQASKGLFNS